MNSDSPNTKQSNVVSLEDFGMDKPTPNTSVDDPTSYLITNKIQLLVLCIGLVLSVFIAAVDETIVATALAAITDEFKASSTVSWVASAYLLTTNASTPLYGKFSDIFGRKPCLLFALTAFLVGSILCGFANNIYIIIIFRGLSGFGAGGLIALPFIIISDSVPIEKRGLYMSLISITFAVSNMFGPILGGVFVDHLTWRWVFYINIPISIIAGAVIIFFLPLRKTTGSIKSKLNRVDVLGTITLIAGIVLFILAMNWGGKQYSWKSLPVIICLVIGFIMIILFIIIECRHAIEPVIPFRIFNRNVILANLASLCMGFCMFVFIYYWPLYFQIVKQSKATEAGTELLPVVLGICFFAAIGGALVNLTKKYYTVKWTGMLFLLTGTSLMCRLFFNITRVEEIIYPLLVGIGIGINIPTNTIVCQASVSPNDTAVVTAIINFTITLGGIFGLAIHGAIFNNVLLYYLNRDLPQLDISSLIDSMSDIHKLDLPNRLIALQAYQSAFSVMFLCLIPFSLVALIAVLFLKPISISPSPSE